MNAGQKIVAEDTDRAIVIIKQLLDKALAEALQAVRTKEARIEATPLVKLFGLYARGLQTLCRNRSIMLQNVSEVDRLPYTCVSHKIIAIRHLQWKYWGAKRGQRT